MRKELMDISEESLMKLEDFAEMKTYSVEEVHDMLEVSEKGNVKQKIHNCMIVLKNDPILQKAICRDELTGRVDIRKEMPWKRRGKHITDTDINNLKLYLEEKYELTSERVITTSLDIIANENSYHPIQNYLESLEWDGINRISNLLPHFLGAERNVYTEGVMKMHMLAAISRVYEPGIKYDIMLCLVGGQGAGKSTFFRFLALKDEWFTDDLDRLEDDNIYRKLQGHWIIEMGECNCKCKKFGKNKVISEPTERDI